MRIGGESGFEGVFSHSIFEWKGRPDGDKMSCLRLDLLSIHLKHGRSK